MPRLATGIALLLLLALSPGGAAQPSSSDTNNASPASVGATVVIDSRPEHAEIHLNGRFVGTTPLSYRLTPGEHEIELVRAQFDPWVRKLTVTDTSTRVVALLKPNHAKDCSER